MITEPPVKVGILGAGYIADWHMRALRQLRDVNVVAVADANLERARSFAASFGIADAVGSIDELVRNGRCDVVHVLLPPDLHFDAASALLNAGTHVFLEKPACVMAEDCRKLLEQSRRVSRVVGVNHNFLFASVYDRLKADVEARILGPIREVSIVWNKELGQLRSGPFSGWMFREPGNVMLEIGPHSMAHVLDLVGTLESLNVDADRAITLPNDRPFYRRWQARCTHKETVVNLAFSLEAGFTEHRIHVRGLIGSATADFEAGTYVLRRHAPLPEDFERHRITRNEGRDLVRQGRRKLLRYVLSKLKLSKSGNDFGVSIARAIARFYSHLGVAGSVIPISRGLSLGFAADVVAACAKIAASVPGSSPAVSVGPIATSKPATVLVLGGAGFIGQAVVRQLAAAGHGVRMMVRDPRYVPRALHDVPLEFVAGDLSRIDQLERAVAGVSAVYHLARAHVKTWDDYLRYEIAATRNVAEACIKTGVKRLVYTGTIDSYYTGSAEIIHDDSPLDHKIHRRNLYARAKASSESLLQELQRDKGLAVAIFRPGIVIGRGGSPFHWGVGMWTANAVCRLWGPGTNPLPIVLVDDVARALVRAIDADGVIGETFNLVGEPLLSARDYIVELEKAGRFKLNVRPRSPWSFYGSDLFNWLVKMIVRHPERRLPSLRDWKSRTQRATFDCAKAKRVLGWIPCAERETIIREGIVAPVEEWLA
jgi:nucleoside-diphosphate-sugar epimerase/predicted dehydrogenase